VNTGIYWENLREGDHLEDSDVDGRIILKWIFETWDGGHGMDRCVSGQRQIAGCCESDNEASVFTKCGTFLE
jgi:hypothetical protein